MLTPQGRLGRWLLVAGRVFGRPNRLYPGPSRRSLVFVGVICMTAALLALAFASDAQDLRHGVAVAGIVTGTSGGDDDQQDPSVTVSFAIDRVEHECTTTQIDGHPEVHSRVRLRYVRDDPEGSCAVDDAGQSYVPAGVAGGVAACSAAWVVRVSVARRRERKSQYGADGWCDTW